MLAACINSRNDKNGKNVIESFKITCQPLDGFPDNQYELRVWLGFVQPPRNTRRVEIACKKLQKKCKISSRN